MKAMIMAAGIGTRLMPLTVNLPKPMIPIVNKPVMEYGVSLLKSHGIKDIIANTHYLPDCITEYFSNGQALDVNMVYSYEKILLGTAGGVKNNKWFLDETFIVVSGDALTNINISAMYAFHKRKKALATLALKSVENVTQYGVVVKDKKDKIIAFQEKPQKEEALSNLVNTGIYIFEPEIFDLIPEGFYDFGKGLFPKLVSLNESIYGYKTDDYWCDVGNIEIYKNANWDVLNGEYQLQNLAVNPIDKSVRINDSNLMGNKIVTIGENSVISKGAILNHTIVLENTIVRENVRIDNSVIGSNCLIGKGTIIGSNVIVGAESIIGNNVIIKDNLTIAPGSNIPSNNIVTETMAL